MSMKFRNEVINDIVIIGPFAESLFIKKLMKLAHDCKIIDLQYSTVQYGRYTGHSALVLIRKEKN